VGLRLQASRTGSTATALPLPGTHSGDEQTEAEAEGRAHEVLGRGCSQAVSCVTSPHTCRPQSCWGPRDAGQGADGQRATQWTVAAS